MKKQEDSVLKTKMSAFIPPFILTLSAKYKRNADHFILVLY